MTTNNNIDISKYTAGNNTCDLKCAYNFDYPETNLVATNNGIMINCIFDNNTSTPVVYNQQKYSVASMMIVSPSIHFFNGNQTNPAGNQTNAEIIIVHTPSVSGNQLAVCIPIIQSNDTNEASNFVTNLIQSVSNTANKQGQQVNINTSITLNTIIPNQPFYSYTDGNNIDFIVFDISDAIGLNSDTITSLQQMIRPFSLPTPGNGLFYNKNGPNHSNIGDGIYIQCNPVGASTDKVPVEYSKNSSSFDIFSGNNENVIKIILQILFVVLVFGVLVFIFMWFRKPSNVTQLAAAVGKTD
jgi:carbonic anhydrase